MKLTGDTRRLAILTIVILAATGAFMIYRQASTLERIVQSMIPKGRGAAGLAGTHWSGSYSAGATRNLQIEDGGAVRIDVQGSPDERAVSTACVANGEWTEGEGLYVQELTCNSGARTFAAVLLVSQEDGRRHAVFVPEGRDVFEGDYYKAYGQSEPDGIQRTCPVRIVLIDDELRLASARLSRYVEEAEVARIKSIVGEDYSPRELVLDWKAGSAFARDAGESLPLTELRIFKDKAYVEAGGTYEHYHLQIYDSAGSQIDGVDIFQDPLEYCSTTPGEMTVIVTLPPSSDPERAHSSVAYQFEPERGCNVFAEISNESAQPVSVSIGTQANNEGGGFGGALPVGEAQDPPIPAGQSVYVHGEVPGLYMSTAIRDEFGEGGLNEDWLFPDLWIAARGTSPSGAACFGGLGTYTNDRGKLEKCMRENGSVFLNIRINQAESGGNCQLGVSLD